MALRLLVADRSADYEADDLRRATNAFIIESTKNAIENERTSTVEVIRHLQEIYRRSLYLEYGYPNLFEMLTKYFKYCNGSAQRRINAMKLTNALPQVEEKLESGELSLSAAAQIQVFLNLEKKEKTAYTVEQKAELVEVCLEKSTREVERELASRNPQFIRRESIRPISGTDNRAVLNFSNELLEKLDRLKTEFSHIDPTMTYEALIERLAGAEIERIEKAKAARKTRVARIEPAVDAVLLPAREVSARHESLPVAETSRERSRHIPNEVRREVIRAKAEHGCDFVSRMNGQRCGSKFLLQIDHRVPFSRGGRHEFENLRMLCSKHNRWVFSASLR